MPDNITYEGRNYLDKPCHISIIFAAMRIILKIWQLQKVFGILQKWIMT